MPASPSIHEARVVPLKRVTNDRGHLLEVQRSDDAHFPGFGQAYLTSTHPGVVKAWYRHATQFDQLALVVGRATVVLYDSREASPSYAQVVEIVLDEASPCLVQIPPGVWHGFRADGGKPLHLLHLNTVPYDPVNIDEERLPPDSDRLPDVWRGSSV